jgi:molecular chaperone DnaJ
MARCGNCEGTGQVRRVSKSFFGQFVNIATCPKCRGEGRTITDPCKECRGQGREKKPRNLVVSIPGGVNDGSRMRLNGEGDTGMHGGPPGHMYVLISVAEHAFFKREEEYLIYELSMNPAQAALGFEAAIPTLDGDDTALKIPAGTQTGKAFTIKGKGVQRLHSGGRGDLIVRATVETPTDLTEEQRDLMKRLAESFGTPVSEDKSLLKKIKSKLG